MRRVGKLLSKRSEVFICTIKSFKAEHGWRSHQVVDVEIVKRCIITMTRYHHYIASTLKSNPSFLNLIRATTRKPRALTLDLHQTRLDRTLFLFPILPLLPTPLRQIRITHIASDDTPIDVRGVRILRARGRHEPRHAALAEHVAARLGQHGLGGVTEGLLARRADALAGLGLGGLLLGEGDGDEGV